MIVNKVTELYASGVNSEMIQNHINENNADGWYLISADNMVGWYRFFWAKEVTE